MINSFRGRWVFLSNFYPSEIKHDGLVYPTVEHYYMASKIKGDQMINGQFYPGPDVKEMIAHISTPAEAKKFGKKLKLRKDWEEVKLSVMEWGLREKFKDEKLREMMLQTGDEELVEKNLWHDNFWGSCTCPKCGDKGQNNLGKLLMIIRNEIINGKKPTLQDILFPKT